MTSQLPSPPLSPLAEALCLAVDAYRTARGTVDSDYKRLSEVGLEFTTAPIDMPYGRDYGLHAQSGNQLRLA